MSIAPGRRCPYRGAMSSAPQPAEAPLESWKAIAAYLGRDARTVMRWEKSEGLPVRRHHHLTRSSVYAYPRELDAWRANRRGEVPVSGRVMSGPGSRLIVAAATLAISVLSAGGGRFVGPLAAAQDDVIDRPVGWPENASMAADAAMSPDGRYVSYIDMTTRDLHVKDLQSGVERRMTSIASVGGFVEYSAISRDGRFVAYIAKDAGRELDTARLVIAPVARGDTTPPRVLLTGSWFAPREWSADDRHLVVVETAADRKVHIAMVNVADASIRKLKTFETRTPGFHVRLSPDGGFIAYDAIADPPERQRDTFLLPTNGGEAIPLLEGPSSDSVVGWSPDGRQLLFQSDRWGSSGLWALPVANGKATAEPTVLRPDFHGDMFTVTSRGDLFYEREVGTAGGPPRTRLLVATISPDTGALIKAPWFAAHDRQADSRAPRWSADGQYFMYSTARPTGPVVSIRSAANSVVREIPRRVGYVYTFDVSADGAAIVFRGTGGIFLVDAQSGDVRRLVENIPTVNGHYHPQFTADGKAVTYFKHEFARGEQPALRSYVELDLATGNERVLLPDLRDFMANRHPMGRSPDGRYLLAALFTSPTTLSVYDTKSHEIREVFRINRENGFNPEGGIQWMPDSRALVANGRAGSGSARDVWWIPVDGRESRKLDIGVDNLVDSAIAIHPDGQQIAFVAGDPVVSKTSSPRREFRMLERFLPR